jgi:hypothetical protein
MRPSSGYVGVVRVTLQFKNLGRKLRANGQGVQSVAAVGLEKGASDCLVFVNCLGTFPASVSGSGARD